MRTSAPAVFAAGDVCCTTTLEQASAQWFQMRLWTQVLPSIHSLSATLHLPCTCPQQQTAKKLIILSGGGHSAAFALHVLILRSTYALPISTTLHLPRTCPQQQTVKDFVLCVAAALPLHYMYIFGSSLSYAQHWRAGLVDCLFLRFTSCQGVRHEAVLSAYMLWLMLFRNCQLGQGKYLLVTKHVLCPIR